MSQDEKAYIADYACRSRESLEIAVQVAHAFSRIQIRVIRSFFEALQMRLREELAGAGWEFANGFARSDVLQHTRFEVYRTEWTQPWSSAISSERGDGRHVICGVVQRDQFDSRAGDVLRGELDSRIGRGRASSYWPWYRPMAEYDDWTRSASLSAMLGGPEAEALDTFAEALLKQCEIIDLVLTEGHRGVFPSR